MFENFDVPANLIPSDPRFGCGPSLIPLSFVDALRASGTTLLGTSHRKKGIRQLVEHIQEGLKSYFSLPDDFVVAMGNGGATFLFDMIGLGAVEKSSTHFTCGEFSQKWFSSHQAIPWIEAKKNAVEMGQGITPVAQAGFDTLCTTLNETSTGVQLCEIPTVGGETLLAMDATSGAGQVPVDVSKVDIFFFSPQKVFASEGGLFVAILSPKAQERVLRLGAKKERYIPGIMSWQALLENARQNQTFTTPSVSTLFFLHKQVELMNKLGYAKVQQLAEKKAQLLYGWAEEKDYLSPFIKEDKYRSRSVACVDVDERLPIDGLLKRLEEKGIANGINAYRKLGRNQFRIALFHNIAYEDLEKLTQLLSLALER